MAANEHYYHAGDLARFGEIGNDAPELAKTFFDYYGAVFAEGMRLEREKSRIAPPPRTRYSAPTASTRTRRTR